MPDGSERRVHPRVPVRSGDFQLLHPVDSSPIGAVANISKAGLLVNSVKGYPINATLQGILNWRTDDSPEMQSMAIGITALWATPADRQGAHWIGFHIIDISAEDQQRLDALIAGAVASVA